jgi:hypothetical protein
MYQCTCVAKPSMHATFEHSLAGAVIRFLRLPFKAIIAGTRNVVRQIGSRILFVKEGHCNLLNKTDPWNS